MGYSPVITTKDGLQVQLDSEHPGFSDPVYRERRNQIAALSYDYKPGDPIPSIAYLDSEHDVWSLVSKKLTEKHKLGACADFLVAKQALELPIDHVPQLGEVSAKLSPISSFKYQPVAGLAPLRDFYGSFASHFFFSTQYLRHPSSPFYTPEPDIIHEVIGHANQLASPRFAEVYEAVGEAVKRTLSQEALVFLSRVFWFTMEFGVVIEGGEPKAYGAGILSSIGEMDVFQKADIRPFNLEEMGNMSYDIAHYQPLLYSFNSIDELYDKLLDFFNNFDDTAFAAITKSAPTLIEE